MIKLSIIIPHYNSPDLLKKLLDSIPQKQEIQVIVVDDKSNLEISKYFQLKEDEEYSHVLFLNNTGIKSAGSCRNIGMEKATGRWILFADADDYFVVGFYEIISRYFECDNDVIFFLSTSIELDTGNVSTRDVGYNIIKMNYSSSMGHEEELKLRYSLFAPWTKMIRHDFIKEYKIAFDEIIASNDVMFSTRVGYHMRSFQVVEKVIYCVTRSKGSLTTNICTEIIDARLKAWIDRSNFLVRNITPVQYKSLNITGTSILGYAIKGKLPPRKIFQIYMTMLKNGIKPFKAKSIFKVYKIKKIREQDSRYYITDKD